MTTAEFSDEFDVLLASYMNSSALSDGQGLMQVDEYEKSVLLTQAQEEIVSSLYSGKLTGEGFESTEIQRRYLDELVVTTTIDPEVAKEEVKNAKGEVTTPAVVLPTGVDSKSKFFKIPEDVWFITYEAANLNDGTLKCNTTATVDIIPVRLDEYHLIKGNPFRGASANRVLRIDYGHSNNLGSNLVELVSKYTISSYYLKYLKKPDPIILVDINNDNLSIDNQNTAQTCKLNTALHRAILREAVALAIKRLPSSK